MPSRPPSTAEIRAAIIARLSANTYLTDWFAANMERFRVVEYNVDELGERHAIAVDITDVSDAAQITCPRFPVVFDLHLYDVTSSTTLAHQAMSELEAAMIVDLLQTVVDGHDETVRLVLEQVVFEGRLPQAMLENGWTVGTSFSGVTYYL